MALRHEMEKYRRSKGRITVSHLPKHLLFEIINKMNNKELIRMRKTCSFVNSVVEGYENMLTSRPALGANLVIEFKKAGYYRRHRNQEELHFSSTFDGESVKLVEDDFKKNIAGISFKLIDINIERREPYLQILKVFEQLQPVCKRFNVKNCPLDLVVPLTNCVTFINAFNVNCQDYPEATQTDTILETLKMAKNRSKFNICIPHSKITEGILDKMKYFSHVRFGSNITGLHELLLDLHSTTEKITLKTLFLHLEQKDIFLSIPSLSFIQRLRQPKWSKVDGNAVWDVRLIILPSQFVVIEEHMPYGVVLEYSNLIFSFIDKTATALEEKLRAIHFKSEYNEFAAENNGNEDDVMQEDNDDEDSDPDDYENNPRRQYKIFKEDLRTIVSSIIENAK